MSQHDLNIAYLGVFNHNSTKQQLQLATLASKPAQENKKKLLTLDIFMMKNYPYAKYQPTFWVNSKLFCSFSFHVSSEYRV